MSPSESPYCRAPPGASTRKSRPSLGGSNLKVSTGRGPNVAHAAQPGRMPELPGRSLPWPVTASARSRRGIKARIGPCARRHAGALRQE